MSEPKWTPGPWHHAWVASGWDGVYEPNGAVVCRLALNEPANADLIAAAPELYATLLAILETRGKPMPEEYVDGGVSYTLAKTAYDAAIAVLAKARGEKP